MVFLSLVRPRDQKQNKKKKIYSIDDVITKSKRKTIRKGDQSEPAVVSLSQNLDRDYLRTERRFTWGHRRWPDGSPFAPVRLSAGHTGGRQWVSACPSSRRDPPSQWSSQHPCEARALFLPNHNYRHRGLEACRHRPAAKRQDPNPHAWLQSGPSPWAGPESPTVGWEKPPSSWFDLQDLPYFWSSNAPSSFLPQGSCCFPEHSSLNSTCLSSEWSPMSIPTQGAPSSNHSLTGLSCWFPSRLK